METKQFEISVNGKGTQAEILASLKAIETQIENTPVKLSRINARLLKQSLKRAYNTGAEIEMHDIIKAWNLHTDFCDTCGVITPTIRTSKYCQCAICNTDRQADITGNIETKSLTGSISEIDPQTK